MSDKIQVEYSVPQGSVAEPLTFLSGLSFFYVYRAFQRIGLRANIKALRKFK